jgi:hypothetical protein
MPQAHRLERAELMQSRDQTKAGMPTTLQTARYPATKTIAGTALPAAARAYRPTTGRTAGSIIAAIMVTHAMRNAANDIADRVSIGIASPRISAALTTIHHQPRPATPSSNAGNQISVRDRPRPWPLST